MLLRSHLARPRKHGFPSTSPPAAYGSSTAWWTVYGGGDNPVAAARTLQDLGAYVGEVLVRRARARWVDLDDTASELFRQPVGVRTPDGRARNPLGKVVNRFELGLDESAYELFLQVPRRPKRLPLSGTADTGDRQPRRVMRWTA